MAPGCNRWCWGCRYYISFFGGYCNYRYVNRRSRGCPPGRGCTCREKTGQKRTVQGKDEIIFVHYPPSDNEMQIVRLNEEARRRNTSYGKLIWALDAAEIAEISQGRVWQKRRERLLAALGGRPWTPELRSLLRELCAGLRHGEAAEEYLLTSNAPAKQIAARHHISISTLRGEVRQIYAMLGDEKEERKPWS